MSAIFTLIINNKLMKRIKNKKILFNIFFIIFTISAFSQENTDTILQRGYSLIENKKYNEAIAEFDKILSSDKTNERAITGKTNALLLLNKYDEALSFANNGINNFPNNPYYYYASGMVNHFNKQYKKAVEMYTKAISLLKNENTDKILFSRAISYIELKYYEEALNDLNIFISNNDNNSNAYFQRGRIYFILGEYPNAIEDFNKAIGLNKTNGYLYYNLGMTYFKNNDPKNACINLQNACQLGIGDACKMVITDCAKKF
jgi:tetratricopeptide (TPR) repeat protein